MDWMWSRGRLGFNTYRSNSHWFSEKAHSVSTAKFGRGTICTMQVIKGGRYWQFTSHVRRTTYSILSKYYYNHNPMLSLQNQSPRPRYASIPVSLMRHVGFLSIHIIDLILNRDGPGLPLSFSPLSRRRLCLITTAGRFRCTVHNSLGRFDLIDVILWN